MQRKIIEKFPRYLYSCLLLTRGKPLLLSPRNTWHYVHLRHAHSTRKKLELWASMNWSGSMNLRVTCWKIPKYKKTFIVLENYCNQILLLIGSTEKNTNWLKYIYIYNQLNKLNFSIKRTEAKPLWTNLHKTGCILNSNFRS